MTARPTRMRVIALGLAVALGLAARTGLADPPPAADAAPSPFAPPPAPYAAPAPPAPYVAPWLLRSVTAVNVARWDNTLALYENAAGLMGATYVGSFSGGFKIPHTGGPSEGVQLVARLTTAYDNPAMAPSAAILANPVVGAAYARRLPRGFRVHASLGLTLPVGMGGGDTPDPAEAAVRGKAALARYGMDNAIFAVNDLTVMPGGAVAWVDRGFTVQAEASLLLLSRVRGAAAQKEAFKVNFTSGLFVGYFVVPSLSVGLELHYQRYFLGPPAIAMAPATVDNLSMAGGVRLHVPVAGLWLRCGVSYGGGLDDPLAGGHYSVVQLDCPFYF